MVYNINMKTISILSPECETQLLKNYKLDNAQSNTEKIETVKRMLYEVIHNELTGKQREYLLMYYFDRMKLKEIASIYNVNISTISRTIKRGEKNIYNFLKYYMLNA